MDASQISIGASGMAHDLFCLQPKYEMAVQVTGDAIYSC